MSDLFSKDNSTDIKILRKSFKKINPNKDSAIIVENNDFLVHLSTIKLVAYLDF